MKPSRPVAHITIAGRRLSAPEAALAGMEISLGRFSHDRVRLVLWTSSKFASAQPPDEIKVELGDEDSEADVWGGKISAVYASPEAICVEGLASTAELSGKRKSQTYLNQGASDIVRDLAGSVDVDDADTDLQLEYYSVDSCRSVWGHLIDLAQLAGAEITNSPAGALRFVQVRQTTASRKFRYGADVLSWRVGTSVAPGSLSFVAHGAASEAGSEKWHWISQQAASQPSVSVGGFHSQDSADALTTAASGQAQRAAKRGRLRLVGTSDLRVGDVFGVTDLPSGDPGDLRALSVEHHFSGVRGFWTDVKAEGA